MRLRTTSLCGTALVAVIALGAHDAHALTTYHLKVRSASSVTQRFAFALTCADSAANTLTIFNAVHNGTGSVPSTEGGPIGGDLLTGANPADTTTISGGAGYSELMLELVAVTEFDCELDLSEQAAPGNHASSEASLYYLPGAASALYPTSDPLGANVLMAIDVTGAAGGDLSVFSPMMFVAPDTLLLGADFLDAPQRSPQANRLRFSSPFPNPAKTALMFEFIVPDPGGDTELRVFDIAGREVAAPLIANLRSGPHAVSWQGRASSGDQLPPGVYLVMLRMSGQASVRRLTIAR